MRVERVGGETGEQQRKPRFVTNNPTTQPCCPGDPLTHHPPVPVPFHRLFRALTTMKQRLKGAQTGHSLLKRKAEALQRRFRDIVKKIQDVRRHHGSDT